MLSSCDRLLFIQRGPQNLCSLSLTVPYFSYSYLRSYEGFHRPYVKTSKLLVLQLSFFIQLSSSKVMTPYHILLEHLDHKLVFLLIAI